MAGHGPAWSPRDGRQSLSAVTEQWAEEGSSEGQCQGPGAQSHGAPAPQRPVRPEAPSSTAGIPPAGPLAGARTSGRGVARLSGELPGRVAWPLAEEGRPPAKGRFSLTQGTELGLLDPVHLLGIFGKRQHTGLPCTVAQVVREVFLPVRVPPSGPQACPKPGPGLGWCWLYPPGLGEFQALAHVVKHRRPVVSG